METLIDLFEVIVWPITIIIIAVFYRHIGRDRDVIFDGVHKEDQTERGKNTKKIIEWLWEYFRLILSWCVLIVLWLFLIGLLITMALNLNVNENIFRCSCFVCH